MAFFDTPRIRRLKRDHEEMLRLADESSILTFTAEGSPPERYMLRFNGRGLGPKGFVQSHQVDVSLGADYPVGMPAIDWRTPIRHPNISGGRPCFGAFTMSPYVRLVEIVEILWDMARMAVFNPYGGHGEGGDWYKVMKQVGGFPVDPRILRDKAPPTPPPSEEPGEPDILIMGAAGRGALEEWIVTRDGETIATFPSFIAAMNWLHRAHSYSVDHAVRHEGYDIVQVQSGKVAWSYRREVPRLDGPGLGASEDPYRLKGIVTAWLNAHRMGPDFAVYTPEEWRARGEPYGNDAVLTIATEGYLYQLLNYGDWPGAADALEEWEAFLRSLGLWYDLGYAWSVHLYPLPEGAVP